MKFPFKRGDLIKAKYLVVFSSRLAQTNPTIIDYRNHIFKIIDISDMLYTNVDHQKYYAFSAVSIFNGIKYGFVYGDDNKYELVKRNYNYNIKIKIQ